MKNRIKIAIIVFACLFAVLLSGCSKSTKLTVDNMEEYIELDVSFGAADS